MQEILFLLAARTYNTRHHARNKLVEEVILFLKRLGCRSKVKLRDLALLDGTHLLIGGLYLLLLVGNFGRPDPVEVQHALGSLDALLQVKGACAGVSSGSHLHLLLLLELGLVLEIFVDSESNIELEALSVDIIFALKFRFDSDGGNGLVLCVLGR